MSETVATHYGSGDLVERVRQALVDAGKDPDHLTLDDLTMMEEFHTLGRLATLALADAAGVRAEDRVLDVGAGIGGPARLLASMYGCSVATVDLTPEFCDIARWLNTATGIEGIDVRCASALELPFDDGTFDLVWTQHVQMNIAEKAAFYAELARMMAPSGRVAQWEIAAGPEQPLQFPVPWSDTPELSHLVTPDELLAAAAEAGLQPLLWEDHTDEAVEFFQAIAAAPAAEGPNPIGVQVFVPDFPAKAANMVTNLQEGRVRLIRGVLAAA